MAIREPIRSFGTKRDVCENIGAFVLNFARTIRVIALTENCSAQSDPNSRTDSFFWNEAGR
jgi:hypothetical protein